MSVMATTTTSKMKQSTTTTATKSTTEFLSGDGVDLAGSQKPKLTEGGITTDQDDLDLFLSEITVQFDDEVQTLYVGPVEIVDDDDDDDDGTAGNNNSGPVEVLLQAKEEMVEDPVEQISETSLEASGSPVVQKSDDAVKLDDVTVELPSVEAESEAEASSSVTVDAASASQPEEESSSQQEQLPSLPSPSVPLEMPPSPSLPPSSPSPQPAEAGEEEDVVVPTEEAEGGGEPPNNGVVDEDEANEGDSANDDRLHRLTAAGVDIDPKNGAAEQPVSSEEELVEDPEPSTRIPSPEPEPAITDTVTPTEEPSTLEAEEEPTHQTTEPQPESPVEPVASQPTENSLPIATCTDEEEPQPEPAQEEQQLPTVESQPTTASTPPRASPKKSPKKSPRKVVAIKEEIRQLAPVLPAQTTSEESKSVVNKLEVEQSQLQEQQLVAEHQEEEEEEDDSPEGELIVPDVLVPGTYDKDSSPAGSDSGIENEGTDLSKVASPEEEEEEGELTAAATVTDETTVVENIPGEINDVGVTDDQGDSAENGNTQVVILEEIVIQGAKGTLIQCARCAMCFRKELWYKKHLMNYHGIDLSNIAHFLSNLQTLDEGIQDGDGTTEQEFEEFHLEEVEEEEEDGDAATEDGGNNDATDKTEEQGEGSKRKSEEYIVEGVKRVRQQEGGPSTPSPVTLEMYPEVKLSTSKGKPKAARRRKEKLVLINSDADMRIKHEYAPVAANSEESTSGSSQSSQPLMNNMYVVRYLEQAALMVGSSGETAEAPSLNKENSKLHSSDHLSYEEVDDGMTPFERSKIVETNEGDKLIFTCSICESVFEDRQTIQEHVNIVHKDVKRRSCPHCGRTFNQTGDLTRHVRIHTGIRPFKCPFDGCEYAFISSGDLHKHVRRHNQMLNPIPKPHVCTICGKDFERGYDLKRHSSMHAKDDPNFQGFNCELCGKMFARKDQYRAHTYRHIGYKPHKCTQCDKTFSDASNYAKHVKVHAMDGVELYCHHCEKAFKNKMAISKHVLRCKYKSSARKTSSPKRKKKATVVKLEQQEPELMSEAMPETESPDDSLGQNTVLGN